MLSVALPVLLTVTVWAVLVVPTDCAAKVRLEEVRLTTGPDPVPDKPIACGLPTALSAILIAAERLPTAAGVNVTVTVQSTPAVNVPGQVLVSEKSPGFAPVTLMPEISRLVFPVLVSVTDCEALVVPTDWVVNERMGVRERPPRRCPCR
jgi:hypothetical protein